MATLAPPTTKTRQAKPGTRPLAAKAAAVVNAESQLLTLEQAIAAGIEPVIRVHDYAYYVDYGPDVSGMAHTVTKQGKCITCRRAEKCPAVPAVRDHLKAGGERAPDPPFDFWPWAVEVCPICGAKAEARGGWTKEHGYGWKCAQHGTLCWWVALAVPMAVAKRLNPYLIPPRTASGEIALPQPTDAQKKQAFDEVLQLARDTWLPRMAARQEQARQTVAYPGVKYGECAAAAQAAPPYVEAK